MHVRRSRSTALAAALVLAVVVVSVDPPLVGAVLPSPSSVVSPIGMRLLDVPADAGDDPRAQESIVDQLAPGTTIDRRVELSNPTAEAAHIELYAAAASIEDGVFVGADEGTPNDLSDWTSVGPAAVDLPPGGTATVTVTIAVPRGAAPGEQYAEVWAETRTGRAGGFGDTEPSRVGLRLYVYVGAGGSTTSDFSVLSVRSELALDGGSLVVARVRNTGARALDMTGLLWLTDGPDGVSTGPFPAELDTTVAIGGTERVVVDLARAIRDGSWDAKVTLRSGLVTRTASGRVRFPAGGADAADTDGGSGWLLPVLGGVALLGLAALLALVVRLVLVVRRRKRRPVQRRGADRRQGDRRSGPSAMDEFLARRRVPVDATADDA